MQYRVMFLTAILGLALVACDSGPKSASGFRLPDGDIERGKTAFLEMKCNACHTVAGVDLPAPEVAPPVTVVLGGETNKVHTYGQLVTAIINPSHELAKGYPLELIQSGGQSRMTNYNEVMTVHQMIDLVAFLQSRYKVVLPEPVGGL